MLDPEFRRMVLEVLNKDISTLETNPSEYPANWLAMHSICQTAIGLVREVTHPTITRLIELNNSTLFEVREDQKGMQDLCGEVLPLARQLRDYLQSL